MHKWFAAIILSTIYMPAAAASDTQFYGPLRARDLTPFGYLRLDMRPSYAVSLSPGAWGIETRLAYQNTWAMTPKVESYLKTLPGRRELGPDDWQAIRDLPGENYLVDLELAQLDVMLHRQLSADWGAYVSLSAAAFGGGYLDSTIEGFHDLIGSDTFGRPAASRNDVNLLFDLNSTQFAVVRGADKRWLARSGYRRSLLWLDHLPSDGSWCSNPPSRFRSLAAGQRSPRGVLTLACRRACSDSGSRRHST